MPQGINDSEFELLVDEFVMPLVERIGADDALVRQAAQQPVEHPHR